MKAREYQITLTDGNRTGIATLRLDGKAAEWIGGKEDILTMLMPVVPSHVDYGIAHVRDIPDESEGAA